MNESVEKQEYIFLDFVKFICAVCVIYIHIPALSELSPEASFWLRDYLCRLAVPMFFLASGYFLSTKFENREKTVAYIKRIAAMYTGFTIIYLPMIIYGYRNNLTSMKGVAVAVIDFVRNFLLLGSWVHFWYFTALISGVIILYIMIKCLKVSIKTVIVIAMVLYIMGIVLADHRDAIQSVPLIGKFARIYFAIFDNTRNGLFVGLPFVSVGYYIGIRKYRIKTSGIIKAFISILALSVMLMETIWKRKFMEIQQFEFLLTSVPVSAILFVLVCSINVDKKYKTCGIYLRKMSGLIYGLHMLFLFYVRKAAGAFFGYSMSNMECFVVVALLSLVTSCVLLYLYERKKVRALGVII